MAPKDDVTRCYTAGFFALKKPLFWSGTISGTTTGGFMLFKRGNIYYCRLFVPLDLRERLQRKELKKSLKTSNRAEARAAAGALVCKAETAFFRLRTAMLTDRELEQITVSILADFSGKIDNSRKDRQDVLSFLGSGVPYGLDFNGDSDVLPLLEASLEFPRNVSYAVQYYENKLQEIVQLKQSGVFRSDFRSSTRKTIQERGLDVAIPPDGWFDENDPDWFQEPSTEFAKVHDAILDGLINGYSLELARVQGVKNPAIEAAISAQIEAAKPRPKLSDLWQEYKAYKLARGKWSAKSAKGCERFFNDTVKVLGNREVADYHQEDAVTLLEALKKNSAATATGKIEFISSLWKFALKTPDSQDLWKVRGNPFAEMQIAGAGNDVKKVVPYSPDDLVKLSAGLLEVRKLVEPHRFWIPLIALYSGMRQDEICQLRTEDIVEEDGVLVFHICHKPEHKQKTKVKKTRVCPVHPILVRLGLKAYLVKQQTDKHDRLFHTLSWSEGKDWTGRIRTWWNSTFQVACLGKGNLAGKSFHSTRHTFIDWFKQNNCYVSYHDRAVIQAMVGHVEGDVTGEHYEEDFSNSEKLRMLRKLDYGFDRELIEKLRRKEY
ncbi:MAG: site-specific integrase [Desulfuromonadaceae bacterium]|nr:site-specific integrase [Desulfuromonadaceae bacterium]